MAAGGGDPGKSVMAEAGGASIIIVRSLEILVTSFGKRKCFESEDLISSLLPLMQNLRKDVIL